MIKTAVQMWDAARATSAGHLIDKFLDWIEQLSITMMPAQPDGLVRIEVRAESRRDR
ncbi:MAG TPA: hypothetical protein VKY22_04970 [Bradyrhizobium sp.]|nr:hypothetical protein [Bradyrhizobium sp.]